MREESDSSNDQHPGNSADEAINSFIGGIQDIDGMDQDVASIIQSLWDKGTLGRDVLLAALKNARAEGGMSDNENEN